MAARHIRFMARRGILEAATRPSRTIAINMGWLISKDDTEQALKDMLTSTTTTKLQQQQQCGVEVLDWSDADSSIDESIIRRILEVGRKMVYTKEYDRHYQLWKEYNKQEQQQMEERCDGSASEHERDSEQVNEEEESSSKDSGKLDKEGNSLEDSIQKRVIEPGPPLPPPPIGRNILALIKGNEVPPPPSSGGGYRIDNSDDNDTLYRTRNSSNFIVDDEDEANRVECCCCFDMMGSEVGIDDSVLVIGLKACTELNGRVGYIRRIIEDGRVEVEIGDRIGIDNRRLYRRVRIQTSRIRRLGSNEEVIMVVNDDDEIGKRRKGSVNKIIRDNSVHPDSINIQRSNDVDGIIHVPEGMPHIPPPTTPSSVPMQQQQQQKDEDEDDDDDDKESEGNEGIGRELGIEGKDRLLDMIYDGIVDVDVDRDDATSTTVIRSERVKVPVGMPHLNEITGTKGHLNVFHKDPTTNSLASGTRNRPISEDTYRRRRSRLAEEREFKEGLGSLEGKAIPLLPSKKAILESKRIKDRKVKDTNGIPPMMPTFDELHLQGGKGYKGDSREDVDMLIEVEEEEERPTIVALEDDTPNKTDTTTSLTSTSDKGVIISGRNVKWRLIEKVSYHTFVGEVLSGRPLSDRLSSMSIHRVFVKAIPIYTTQHLTLLTNTLDLIISKLTSSSSPVSSPPHILTLFGYDIISSLGASAINLFASPGGRGRGSDTSQQQQQPVVEYVLIYSEWCPLGRVYDLILDIKEGNMIGGIEEGLRRERYESYAYWQPPELQGTAETETDPSIRAKGDIWSLGCLAIELLTGRHPVYSMEYGTHQQDICGVIVLDDTAIPQLPINVSNTGIDFITRCLQRNPTLRPSTKDLMEHAWMPADSVIANDEDSDEPEEDLDDTDELTYPSSAPLLFVTHRLIDNDCTVEGSEGAFQSAISYRVPYLDNGFGVGPIDPVSFTTAFCFRAAEPCLPMHSDEEEQEPVPVPYSFRPTKAAPCITFLVYSSEPSHSVAVQLGLSRLCLFKCGALIPETSLKLRYGLHWEEYTLTQQQQLGPCIKHLWVHLDDATTQSISLPQRVRPPLRNVTVQQPGYTLSTNNIVLEVGTVVSVGYATYSGWVYVAYSGGKGWLPTRALELITGDPDLCPFTRIANAMVYPEPEGEDDTDEGDDSNSSSSSDDDNKDDDGNSDDDDSDFAAPNRYFDNPEPAPSY
ncbi:hypothetical protein FOL47_007350 [Perkinsus chesapeaki]|uniref:Protein kinase domain-containing protein n=1 Tax=Perkinsus chesapeaki TaxID=330153 RepID=A0A7J6LL76_PERCH|nr:hypothetical protein FOL47_007350 [Perkinsus chesapeaki]